MDAVAFFLGRLDGAGEVRGLGGRVLRRFQVSFEGVWSDEHRALHLDETVAYSDGRTMSRRWALTPDGRGGLEGYDAVQGARVRARPARDGLKVKFDRPRYASAIAPAAVTLSFVERPGGQIRLSGWASFLGVPVSRTEAALTRRG